MTRKIRFVGDVHGRFEQYKKIIVGVPRSIQVGDMGVGFRRIGGPRDGDFYEQPHYAVVHGDHRFIRGNNDSPDACRKLSQWISDGHIEDRVMFVGGALSIDRELRREGYNWWPDEELSAAELNRIVALYVERKPRVMVTHDCPEEVASMVLTRIPLLGPGKRDFPSRTRYAFQAMWSAHAPQIWIFGHYHMSFDQVLHGGRESGTRFIGLAELEHRDIDLP
jgi:hypothetical protein